MHSLATWEQSPTFDPYNPNQIVREAYVGIPGGYGSFYFNRVPTESTLRGSLRGLGLGAGLTGLPVWGQIAIVGGLAAAAGFLGMKYLGPKVGLAGPGQVLHPQRPGCVETIRTITRGGHVKRGKDGKPIMFVTRVGPDCPKSGRTAEHLKQYQFKRRG